MQDYGLGPYVHPVTHYALLSSVLDLYRPGGIALEFGVGQGESTALIAEHMPVIGFDWFRGLPEHWREGYPKGSFAQDHWPGHLLAAGRNVQFQVGLFEETLPAMHWTSVRDFGLIHIDCDLYSSTHTVLRELGPWLRKHNHVIGPPIIVFDEWHGYPECERYEQRAWREFAAHSGIEWTVLGHSHQSWAIKIV